MRTFTRFRKDIIGRLNQNILQIKTRVAENKQIQLKYPHMIGILESINNSDKLAAIKDLMTFYKIRHMIQITRYMFPKRFDLNQYLKLKELLQDMVTKDRQFSKILTNTYFKSKLLQKNADKLNTTHFFVCQMLELKQTVLQLVQEEKEFQEGSAVGITSTKKEKVSLSTHVKEMVQK